MAEGEVRKTGGQVDGMFYDQLSRDHLGDFPSLTLAWTFILP